MMMMVTTIIIIVMMTIMIMMIIFTLQRVLSSYCTPVAYTTRCLSNKFDVYQHTEHEKAVQM